MQSDLQTFLTIFTIVIVSFVGISYIRRKLSFKKRIDNFDETVMERPLSGESSPVISVETDDFGNQDPLFNEELQKSTEVKVNFDEPLGIKVKSSKSSSKAKEKKIQNPSEQLKQRKSDPSSIISLIVLPRNRDKFRGRALYATLKSNHFYYGKHKIFHRHELDDSANPVLYSVASANEPGVFDEEKILVNDYPGIMIFMLASEVHGPLDVFDSMLKTARKIAVALNGEVCDVTRSNLNTQSISHLKEKISDIQRRIIAQQGVKQAEG